MAVRSALRIYRPRSYASGLDITTDSYIYEVTSKTDYVSGKLKVSGHGLFEDLDDITVLLRGRGNSTWSWPKKASPLVFL